MSRPMRALLSLGREFGGLLMFWLVLWRFGLKPAIAATLLFVVVDGVRRTLRHQPFSRIWILSNTLAIGSGGIDLYATTPFLIRYEAVATNLLTATVFLVGAFGKKPMVQEIAEEWQGHPFELDRPDLRAFFQTFTLAWAAYFGLKAVLYASLTMILPLTQALAVRSVFGTVTFVLMILASRQGERIYRWSRRHGLFSAGGAE